MLATKRDPPLNGSLSELVLSDRLIGLAQDAERAGYTATAEQLVNLACTIFDEAATARLLQGDGRGRA